MKMDNMIQTGMRDEEIVDIMIDRRVNERFERMKLELREELDHWRQTESLSVRGEDFHKVSHYLQMLIEVAGKTEHKVHAEIDEAVKKLKELAYT